MMPLNTCQSNKISCISFAIHPHNISGRLLPASLFEIWYISEEAIMLCNLQKFDLRNIEIE
jgi:hypothetical protein